MLVFLFLFLLVSYKNLAPEIFKNVFYLHESTYRLLFVTSSPFCHNFRRAYYFQHCINYGAPKIFHILSKTNACGLLKIVKLQNKNCTLPNVSIKEWFIRYKPSNFVVESTSNS